MSFDSDAVFGCVCDDKGKGLDRKKIVQLMHKIFQTTGPKVIEVIEEMAEIIQTKEYEECPNIYGIMAIHAGMLMGMCSTRESLKKFLAGPLPLKIGTERAVFFEDYLKQTVLAGCYDDSFDNLMEE